MKYDTELHDYTESLSLTPEIVNLINQAKVDLYYGPSYLDKDGEDCSCFDEGATQFDFRAACDKISEALGNVSDLWIDTQSSDWQTKEPEWCWKDPDGELCMEYPEDWYHMERDEVLAYIVGKELVRYVR